MLLQYISKSIRKLKGLRRLSTSKLKEERSKQCVIIPKHCVQTLHFCARRSRFLSGSMAVTAAVAVAVVRGTRGRRRESVNTVERYQRGEGREAGEELRGIEEAMLQVLPEEAHIIPGAQHGRIGICSWNS